MTKAVRLLLILVLLPALSPGQEHVTDQAVIDSQLRRMAGEWNAGVCLADGSFDVVHYKFEGRTLSVLASGVPGTPGFSDKPPIPSCGASAS